MSPPGRQTETDGLGLRDGPESGDKRRLAWGREEVWEGAQLLVAAPPSGLRPNTGVYWTKIPLLGSWRKTGSVPMPSPLVALPTSVAKPVCWQKRAKDSEAE